MSVHIDIFTDGGCLGNPGPGAWAFVYSSSALSLEGSGYEAQTTNNRMELTAVIRALRELSVHPEAQEASVSVTTDSQYVQKGITDWIHSWIKKGWKTSDKKPVKNVDLWQTLWDLSRSRNIRWNWVAGHAGNELNEKCHTLVEAELKRHA